MDGTTLFPAREVFEHHGGEFGIRNGHQGAVESSNGWNANRYLPRFQRLPNLPKSPTVTGRFTDQRRRRRTVLDGLLRGQGNRNPADSQPSQNRVVLDPQNSRLWPSRRTENRVLSTREGEASTDGRRCRGGDSVLCVLCGTCPRIQVHRLASSKAAPNTIRSVQDRAQDSRRSAGGSSHRLGAQELPARQKIERGLPGKRGASLDRGESFRTKGVNAKIARRAIMPGHCGLQQDQHHQHDPSPHGTFGKSPRQQYSWEGIFRSVNRPRDLHQRRNQATLSGERPTPSPSRRARSEAGAPASCRRSRRIERSRSGQGPDRSPEDPAARGDVNWGVPTKQAARVAGARRGPSFSRRSRAAGRYELPRRPSNFRARQVSRKEMTETLRRRDDSGILRGRPLLGRRGASLDAGEALLSGLGD